MKAIEKVIVGGWDSDGKRVVFNFSHAAYDKIVKALKSQIYETSKVAYIRKQISHIESNIKRNNKKR